MHWMTAEHSVFCGAIHLVSGQRSLSRPQPAPLVNHSKLSKPQSSIYFRPCETHCCHNWSEGQLSYCWPVPSHSEIATAGLAQVTPKPSSTIAASYLLTLAPRHQASSAGAALPGPNILYAFLLLASGSDCKTCLAQSCFWCEDNTPKTGSTTCQPICASCDRRSSDSITSATLLLLDQILSSSNANCSTILRTTAGSNWG